MIRLFPASAALLLLLIVTSAPAEAEALQFDTTPSAGVPAPAASTASSAPAVMSARAGAHAPPGIGWLQARPMTLFDLGMMELSQAATKATEGLFDVSGAVAEYRANVGKIAVTFYARTAYSEQNCTYVVRKLRDQMFPTRSDPSALQRQLASYFVSYNPEYDTPPATIGAELLDGLSFVVFLPGGACELPIMSERIVFLADPGYKPAPPPSSSGESGKGPAAPDVTKLLGTLLGGSAGGGSASAPPDAPPNGIKPPKAPTAPRAPQVKAPSASSSAPSAHP